MKIETVLIGPTLQNFAVETILGFLALTSDWSYRYSKLEIE